MSRSNLLSLDNTSAKEFFLRKESYINFELPIYFTFEAVLASIKDSVRILNLTDLNSAKHSEGVNYHIYGNKDGNYAWRKYELINPILYVSLTNLITEEEAWSNIKEVLTMPTEVKSLGIPITDFKKNQQKASQIKEWFEEVERESLKLALDFEYIYQTDITDCYGSIYTHTIAWALHGKDESKEKRGYNDLLGNKIDQHLQAMSYGQTNGIPQGSILMDFISEIVLAYADRELTKNIPKDIVHYKIIRYRDDYRIFVRNPLDGEKIMKMLSEVLADLGMSLNTHKTKKSESVITDSVKADKLYSLGLKEIGTENLRNELLSTYSLGKLYSNSGSILKRLAFILERYENFNKDYDDNEVISLLIGIGFENPKAFPHSMSIISKILDQSLWSVEKEEIIEKIFRKIKLLPNNGFLEIWLQRIFIKDKKLLKKYGNIFDDKLCELSKCNSNSLFNNSWYATLKLTEISCVDLSIIKTIKNTIEDREISAIDWYLSR